MFVTLLHIFKFMADLVDTLNNNGNSSGGGGDGSEEACDPCEPLILSRSGDSVDARSIFDV
ncbi:unnamed protein product, partial [Oppiella nova]